MKTTVILVLFGLVLTSCASNPNATRKSFVDSEPANVDHKTQYARDTFGSSR